MNGRWRYSVPDLALIGVAAVWGMTFPLVQQAIESISTVAFVQLRFLIATALLLPIAARRGGVRSVLPRDAILPGLLLAGGFLLQTEGLRTVSPSVSAFLTGTSVVLVPILTGLLGWEKSNRRRWVAVMLALFGVFLLTGMRLPASWNRGESLTFLCAVAFAGQIVAVGRVAPRANDPVGLATGQLLIATAFLLGLGLVRGESLIGEPLTRETWIAGIFTGALATAAAFFVQTWAQRKVPAGHVAVCFSSEPVFAALFSIAFFGDRLGGIGWLGALAILGATALVATESVSGSASGPR